MSRQEKYRVFGGEFKLRAVERMLMGESTTVIARQLAVRRKLLYQWKDAYMVGGVEALKRGRGRPRRGQVLGPPPEAETGRAELLRARQRIAELERKVGKQELELDFFAEALRRVDAVRGEGGGKSGKRSTRSSGSRRSKAD